MRIYVVRAYFFLAKTGHFWTFLDIGVSGITPGDVRRKKPAAARSTALPRLGAHP